jgi:predicted RNase H-like HicB family nuclease
MHTYAVTVERGTDGSFLGWVDDLPGCAVRAATQPELLDQLPGAIAKFLAWAGEPTAVAPRIVVTDEVVSEIEADEDTEVLVAADRLPLTNDDLERIRPWLAKSRSELLDLLRRLDDEQLGSMREGSERTIREEIEHVAFVELMYAAWTFDLQSREGLAEFLSWTRDVAIERLEALSGRAADDETWADWGGAPRLEPWSPRKAARRLLWHELLHLRAIERFAE